MDEEIEIKVNNTQVIFAEKHQTGGSVKSAASDQGAEIELDFVLSVEKGQGQTKVIGNDDKITLKDDMCFVAVPPDDNSRAVKSEVEIAIDHIRSNYPDAELEVAEDGSGGAFVVVNPVTLSDNYRQDETWIGFHITSAPEFADVYPHFVRADLQRTDGAPLGEGFGSTKFQFPGEARQAIQISRRTNRAFAPNIRNPAIKLEKVIEWLKSR